MRLWIRRIIFYCFALGFVVSATGVLLYANGYRFNTNSGWFENTGVIHVATLPTGATVSLGTATTGSFWQRSVSATKPFKTPVRITYVLPGRYHVTLSKDTFWDFTRDIDVQAGNTSFLSDVVLLKKSVLKTIAPLPEVQYVHQLNKTSYLIGIAQELFVWGIKNNTTASIFSIKKEIDTIIPSPSGQSVLVQSDNAWYNVDLTQSGVPNVLIPIANDEHVVIDSDDTIYGCGARGINKYSSTSHAVVNDAPVYDCVIEGSTVYTLSAQNTGTVLRSLSIDQRSSLPVSLVDIPESFASFGESNGTSLFIKTKNGSTYLYNTKDPQHHLVNLEGMQSSVMSTDNTFIANNTVEINRYSIQNGSVSKDLITREGEGVSNVTVLPAVPYVFFVRNGKELIALEDSNNPTPNRYTLSTMDHIDMVRMLPDKKTLLIAGTQQGVSGLFALSVVE